MDMSGPFFIHGFFGNGMSLLIALIIGIFFGFFLERGGLGNATKLVGQFYFYDMTVFKMMFTSIITAMLGLFWLSYFGFLDLSLVYIVPTYILPQIVGGLLFGIGFVMGGLCPGTSCVALTTGRIDGFILILGMILGIFVFGEAFPLIRDFYYSTPAGNVTFPQILNISYGTLVFVTVIIAIAGFVAAENIEKKFAKK
jgi:uncharacterized membrane protein YedE/YeeE